MISDRETVRRRKEGFPPGTVIRFEAWERGKADRYSDLAAGTLGVVRLVDDGGTVHTRWANGSYLGMIAGDSFEVQELLAPVIGGLTHFARKGHVNAVCGAERLSNGDVDDEATGWCAECLLIVNDDRN